MDYINISKEAIGFLYKSHASIRKSEIDVKLIALAELNFATEWVCLLLQFPR
jgi:hypothetical protein